MNEKLHFIYVPIPEMDYDKYLNLLANYGFSRGNITNGEQNTFKKLAQIMVDTYNEIPK